MCAEGDWRGEKKDPKTENVFLGVSNPVSGTKFMSRQVRRIFECQIKFFGQKKLEILKTCKLI